jgi:6-methylsalicylate decarboxylase
VRVDVHTHLYPRSFVQAAERFGASDELAGFRTYGRHLARTGDASADRAELGARLDDMDAAGIERSVLSVGAFQPCFADEVAAVETARIANDAYAELVGHFPDRFVAFATLPLPHVDRALDELHARTGDGAFTGVGLGCSAGGLTLDDERFEPLWAELDRTETPVFLHPGVIPGCALGSEDYGLAPSICGAAEIAVAVLRLVARGVTTRYPRIRFVVATTGGSIPLLARRFEASFKQSNPDEEAAIGGSLEALRALYYDTSIVDEPLMLLCARDVLGADRIVLGSDAPRIKPIEAVAYVERSEHLTDDEKRAILDRNAQAALGL